MPQDAVETLNFEKSRVGLGDIYAKQYEAGREGDEKGVQIELWWLKIGETS